MAKLATSHGHSLWFTPGGRAREHLCKMIEELSARYQSPAFPPHITLLGGVKTDREAVIKEASAIAQVIEPFEINCEQISWEDAYFRCLYLQVTRTRALLDAHALASRQFGLPSAEEFRPHLSLLYAELANEEKAKISAQIGGNFARGFHIDHLDVYSTNGPPADWYCIQTLQLMT